MLSNVALDSWILSTSEAHNVGETKAVVNFSITLATFLSDKLYQERTYDTTNF